MDFRYRYIPFGARLDTVAGCRSSVDDDPLQLFENELVVDVGGACWGWGGEQRSIIDHHFFRQTGQFPSASAGVLHLAQQIYQRFARSVDHRADPTSGARTIWLVTHVQPDFDAFCAMYLARKILDGVLPHEGWESLGIAPGSWERTTSGACINWYQPPLAGAAADRRWAVLLAAYAACVDNGRRLNCPPHRSLHSVLYAAVHRGRDYLSNGAVEFFDEVRQRLQNSDVQLNPLMDSVLEGSETFVHELSLLDRQIEVYRQDILRARRSIVYLPKATEPFDEWYPRAQATQLWTEDGRLRADAVASPDHDAARRPVDGLYLRDPHCLLFKEWARSDTENSTSGQGFLFTAIAYSGRRTGALVNSTDYFFAVDPERAGGLHLYNVWVRLQSAELQSLLGPEHIQLREQLEQAEQLARQEGVTRCRAGYERRAGEALRGLLHDPWFDGQNYGCTIIATPNSGSLLPSGSRSDLGDDAVVAIVRQEIELAMYRSPISLHDYPTQDAAKVSRKDEPQSLTLPVGTPAPASVPSGAYRFGSVVLDADVDLIQPILARQIGIQLWQYLEPASGGGLPSDFAERHLYTHPDWVAVWSRRGIVVAAKPSAQAQAERMGEVVRRLAELACSVREFTHLAQQGADPEKLEFGEALLLRVAGLEHELSLPEHRVLARFFDAVRFGNVLQTLRDVHMAMVDRAQKDHSVSLLTRQTEIAQAIDHSAENIRHVQNKIEWLEVAIVSVYAVELLHAINATMEHGGPLLASILLGAAGLTALVAALFLRPWHHMPIPRGWLLVLLVALLLLVAYIAGYDRLVHPAAEPQEPTGNTHQQPAIEEP